MPEAVSAEPSPATVLRQGRVERSAATDPMTGEVTHGLYVDGGVFGDWGKFWLEDIDLELGHVFERNYRIIPTCPIQRAPRWRSRTTWPAATGG